VIRRKLRLSPIVLIIFFFMPVWVLESHAQEPSLPVWLAEDPSQESTQGLALPSGLVEKTETAFDEPTLPSGLNGGKSAGKQGPPQEKQKSWKLPPNVSGYWEIRSGVRVEDDPLEDQISLAETRLQLTYDQYIADYVPGGQFSLTTDFIFDATLDDLNDTDLEDGEGWIDLRETWLSLTPLDFMDLKAGRQILTWGTGNLIFLNDLFPKDYRSFFLSRDLEYLKAPSDAVKVSFYSKIVNVDIVYTPKFDPDRYVNGSRLSFYDPAMGTLRGENMPMEVERPDKWFDDDELALRIYQSLGAYELAAYGYVGFWKGPSGMDPATDRRFFPDLTVLGASLRGTVGYGIGNTEFSWYDSRDDSGGANPFIQNSEMRFLLGYEQEVAADLTLGLQYYLNYMLDYHRYKKALPPGTSDRNRARQWITVDFTQELMAQNQLVLSLFVFYSLSENDCYFRPKVTYDFTDNWKIQVGGNIFTGKQETFFGQFEENSNIYAAVRYSF